MLYDFIFNGIIEALSHPFWQQKGGEYMAILISFLVSVEAGVVSYYICNWLDGDDGDS